MFAGCLLLISRSPKKSVSPASPTTRYMGRRSSGTYRPQLTIPAELNHFIHPCRKDTKNHISADVKHKLIRDYDITDAAVHDSQVFEQILDVDNTSRDVYADSAYRSREKLDALDERAFREHIQRKGCRNKKLSKNQQRGNRTRSKIRSRIEHIFGVQAQRAGRLLVRTIGIVRAKTKIGLRNLAYNIDRYSTLVMT
jgi:IS5 family transposase